MIHIKKNSEQLKKGDTTLPVVSKYEDIQHNSMRLYVYLLSISDYGGKNKPRILSQNAVSPTKIKDILKMKPATIKKYWQLLEENHLIKYEGPQPDDFDWNKMFQIRKKNKGAYYTIPRKSPFRIMPKETLVKIRDVYCVSEEGLKMYLNLAQLQEYFCHMQSPERLFSLADLRDLLQVKAEKKTDVRIIKELNWLKTLKLVDYTVRPIVCNLGTEVFVAQLNSVNYYTDGGEVGQIMTSSNVTMVSEELKESILKGSAIEYFE